ncbi:hypothetical protein B7C62_20565 [Kitasatospora albolonga]|uniref:Uncharacterized protein n=1 Tax=Kitasatospora albolonga TaxID=68173 RepID=A0ABC8BV57_9ACTN|nr:hypothetical protein B7C62_20565 [Kitasatospora albolonga]
MKALHHARSLFTGPGATARVIGAAFVVGTIAAQHPNPVFNRLQAKDTFSVLPNWRFFAPSPAMHDYHFLYRTLDEENATSPWRTLDVIAGRKMSQIFWFPDRRPEKAVFDVCGEVLQVMDRGGFEAGLQSPPYRLITSHLRHLLRAEGQESVKGFQFALARDAGYDTSVEPDMIFMSPYTPMNPEAAL